jgi:hypothetical protein
VPSYSVNCPLAQLTVYLHLHVGEDVAFGGVFRCTMGLAQEYGVFP